MRGWGKFALIQHQRYAHAKQFKRANRALKTLRTYLGRVIRDVLAASPETLQERRYGEAFGQIQGLAVDRRTHHGR